MTITVLTVNWVDGFHNWPEAPDYLQFLRARHRHNFKVECEWLVDHNERAIEIFERQEAVRVAICKKFGQPAEFGNMSCESIAGFVFELFDNCFKCTVREDGNGGATRR